MKNNKLRDKLKSSVLEENNSIEARFINADKIFNNTSLDLNKDEEISSSAQIKPRAFSKSYTLLQSELDNIHDLIIKFAQNGVIVKETEVIRMALCAFLEQDDKISYLNKIYRFK